MFTFGLNQQITKTQNMSIYSKNLISSVYTQKLYLITSTPIHSNWSFITLRLSIYGKKKYVIYFVSFPLFRREEVGIYQVNITSKAPFTTYK